jgi:hypothetical protein
MISFDENGKIIGVGAGPKKVIEEAVRSSEFAILSDGVYATEETHYVDNGELVEKPDRPSSEHIFDYITKQWAYDGELHRQQKWAEIKSARTAEEFSTFSWGGYTFQCDEVSQRRLQGAVQLAAINPDMSLDWTLADNSVQTFMAEEYVQIGQALANHVSECHERGRILRQEIAAAATQEDLEAISW